MNPLRNPFARDESKVTAVETTLALLRRYKVKIDLHNLWPLHIRIRDVMDLWPSSGTYKLLGEPSCKDGHTALHRALKAHLDAMRKHPSEKAFDAALEAQVALLQKKARPALPGRGRL